MPPDDPAAWALSPKPQKPRHVAHVEGEAYLDLLAIWDKENRERLKQEMLPEPSIVPPAAAAEPAKTGSPPLQRNWPKLKRRQQALRKPKERPAGRDRLALPRNPS